MLSSSTALGRIRCLLRDSILAVPMGQPFDSMIRKLECKVEGACGILASCEGFG